MDLKYALFDLWKAFDKGSRDNRNQLLHLRALETITAFWIVFGGSILAQVTRENDSGTSKKQFPDIFNRQNWRRWASRLAEVARDAPDDAEIDSKKLASMGHKRMVELYPEVLE